MRVRLSFIACTVGLALASGARRAEAAEAEAKPQAALFAYDAAAPLNVKEVGVEQREGATVRDVTFTPFASSPETVKAFLVVPQGEGPFAGVLWVHWLGEPATTSRVQFLAEATALASKGIVSLLVDAMWSTPNWYKDRVPEQDRERSVRQVIALRRAMDLLAAQPHVDKTRLGFVGHDYGGMYGMLMAGADLRARTYVYLAAAPSLNHWAFFARQPRSKAEYLRQNADLELTDSLQQVRNASTLFQFANHDAYVSRADTMVLLNAATPPKERKFYETDHAMSIPEVAQDRDAWLLKELAPPH